MGRTASRLSAVAPAAGWIEFGNVGLVFASRIGTGLRATPVLQEGHAAQAGLGLALLFSAAALALLPALTIVAALAMLATMTVIIAIAVGLLLRIALLATLLLRVALLALLTFLAALAPVVALDEAAHALDDAEVVISVLIISFGSDSIARGRRFTRQRLVLVEHLMGVATHPDVRTAAVENLVSIGRAVRVVTVVLLLVMAAATIAAAARPLTIVWSHKPRASYTPDGFVV